MSLRRTIPRPFPRFPPCQFPLPASPVSFPFRTPLQLCLASPSSLLSPTNSLLFPHHSSCLQTLLSPLTHSWFHFGHITFISPVLPLFPIPTLSSVVSMQKQSKQKQSNLIAVAPGTTALSRFVGRMPVQCDQHKGRWKDTQ